MSQSVAMATIDFQGFSRGDGSSTRHGNATWKRSSSGDRGGKRPRLAGAGPRLGRPRIDGCSTRPRSIIAARRVRAFLASRPSTLALMGIDRACAHGDIQPPGCAGAIETGHRHAFWPSRKSLTIWDGRPGSLVIVGVGAALALAMSLAMRH
jgi:hypothetical protein